MIWNILAWGIAIPLTLVLLYLTIEVLFGLKPLPFHPRDDVEGIPRTVIIVPAHDEEAGIGKTILALMEVAPQSRIVVVADNCSDDTALIARNLGAEVLERNNADSRGKAFALDFARDYLSAAPPNVVIIIDADCKMAPGSLERLSSVAANSGQPVQSVNLLVTDHDAPPLVRISNFAMLVKNLIRARGLMRLSGGALLFGTGMAFPWAIFSQLPLKTSEAVEDLFLGLWLARKGIKVRLDDRSSVSSPPASVADSRGQRSRWEHGFIATAATNAFPIFKRGIAIRSKHCVSLGAHLFVPPIALLTIAATTTLAILFSLSFTSGNWAAAILLLSTFILSLAAIFLSWLNYGRTVLPFRILMRVPLYIAWKIPIYVGFFIRRQITWNRTAR
jgi:cellulose synthase/poly-beta-1,6-N-acetylglucosamine synthase-like glycosyltransferase